MSGRCHLPGRRVDFLQPWSPRGPHTCEVPICGSTDRPSSLPCALGPLLLATCSASKSAAQADTHLAEETRMSLSAIPTSPGCPSLLGDSVSQRTWSLQLPRVGLSGNTQIGPGKVTEAMNDTPSWPPKPLE